MIDNRLNLIGIKVVADSISTGKMNCSYDENSIKDMNIFAKTDTQKFKSLIEKIEEQSDKMHLLGINADMKVERVNSALVAVIVLAICLAIAIIAIIAVVNLKSGKMIASNI